MIATKINKNYRPNKLIYTEFAKVTNQKILHTKKEYD